MRGSIRIFNAFLHAFLALFLGVRARGQSVPLPAQVANSVVLQEPFSRYSEQN